MEDFVVRVKHLLAMCDDEQKKIVYKYIEDALNELKSCTNN